MRWTKQHSKNAVAAKTRRRLERAQSSVEKDAPVTAFKPRKAKPDFIIRIEDRFGERIQVSVTRFYGKVFTSTGQSARQLCRGIEHMLTKSA